MSDEYSEEVKTEEAVEERPQKAEVDEVIIRGYPKTVLFYPTMFMSLILAFVAWLAPLNPLLAANLPQVMALLSFVWFIFFAFNFFVVSFEFGKGIVVALILLVVIIILGAALYVSLTGAMIPLINPVLLNLQINANAFLAFFLLFAVVIFISWLSTRFYYFRITPNELIYKKGILGDVERHATTNITVHKEIRDLFEHLLFFFSGRLTIMVPGRKTAIVIDNVPHINRVENLILQVLRRLEIDID